MVRVETLKKDSLLEEELIQIWQQSFGDRPEYIRMFLHENASRMKVIICEEDGKAVSASYLLPVWYVKDQDTREKCYYLYAAATLPDFRGQGCFARILHFIDQYIQEPVILVPASKELAGYYERQGFCVWLPEHICEVQEAGMADRGQVCAASAEEYIHFRNGILKHSSNMLWDEDMMSYICKEFDEGGGSVQKVYVGQEQFFVMCYKTGSRLYVPEILPAYSERCIQALLQEFGCCEARVCLQPPVMMNRPFAKREQGYFNLTMG